MSGENRESANSHWSLRVQRFWSFLCLPIVYFGSWIVMRVVMRYHVSEVKSIRKKFRKICREFDGPLLICPNHLTMVDSAIVMWALAPCLWYWFSFSRFAWNLPEKHNFYHKFFLRLWCYMGKCIPVVRGGTQEEAKDTFRKVSFLLNRGESIMIFPEGTRSRQGKVDSENFSYAVGRFVQSAPNAGVLCVYLRGQSQGGSSGVPKKGDVFHMDIDLIEPKTESKGLRGARDLSTQIIADLVKMENDYFAKSNHSRQ